MSPPSAPDRPWWRRRRGVVTIGVAVVLLLGGGVLAVVWSGRGAEEASVEKALEELDDDGRRDAAFLQPATGVYVYEGTGTERLSLLGTSQEWGPRLPATVTRLASGCWTFKIEYSTNHWQETTYCPRERTLEEAGGRTFQSFDFVVTSVEDLNEFSCDPPGEVLRVDADPGDTWRQSCDGHSVQRGTDVTSTGTNEFLGIASVKVGGERVRAARYRYERTLSGSQTGRETNEIWFRVEDGLPLRAVRDVDVESPSPLGAVTYTEHGAYLLTALAPQR